VKKSDVIARLFADKLSIVIDRDIAKWKPLAQKVGIKVD
jgi:hypothetical protein